MIRTRTTGIAAMIVGVAASTLLVIAPANATAYSPGDPITVDGTSWSVNGSTLTVSTGDFSSPFAHTDLNSVLNQNVNCPLPMREAPDANGDVVLNCDTNEAATDVFTRATWHFYAEGDLARQVVTVRNDSASPVAMGWDLQFTFVSSALTQATSTKPTLDLRTARLLSLNDVWLYNDNPAGVLGVVVAWGHPEASVPHTAALSGFIDQVISDPNPAAMIAPGDRVAVAFYYKIDVAGSSVPADQIDVAGMTAEFATFDGRLVRGLPEGAIVQNWGAVPAAQTPEAPQAPEAPQTPVAPPAPELAETGSSDSALWLGILALGGLLVGGALLVTRRHRTETVAAV